MAWQDPGAIKLIVLHHSAQSVPMYKDWLSVRRIHLRKWHRLGYQKVIERDGTAMDGCQIQRVGIHAPPNRDRFGVCLIGWNEEAAPHALSRDAIKAHWQPEWAWTERQWDALIQVHLPYYVQIMPRALICGHSQTKATLCPGVNVADALLERGWPWPEKLLAGQLHKG